MMNALFRSRPLGLAALTGIVLGAVACSRAGPGKQGYSSGPEPLRGQVATAQAALPEAGHHEQPAAASAPAESPPPAVEAATDAGELVTLADGLRVNRKKRLVEADATVCLRAGALELLVTTPDGKPHESIFTLKPKPSQLHAALLLLGFEDGSPGQYGAFAATGDRLRIDVVQVRDGREVALPANRFVVNGETDENMPDNVFVFAGSALSRRREDDRAVYAADYTGDVVSLSSFPDEVLALPDPASSENSQLIWSVDGSELPDVGTAVVLRFGPAE